MVYGEYHRDKPGYMCTASCDECKEILIFGHLKYCANAPGRTAPHQIVKGERLQDRDGEVIGCIWCKHYHLNLNSQTCYDCLSTEALVNFKRTD